MLALYYLCNEDSLQDPLFFWDIVNTWQSLHRSSQLFCVKSQVFTLVEHGSPKSLHMWVVCMWLMNKLALSTRFDVLIFLFKQDCLMLRMWFLPCIFPLVEVWQAVKSCKYLKYDFMQHLFGLILAEDPLKLLAYIVQSSDMQASNVDGYKFVVESNKDGHGNHVVI